MHYTPKTAALHSSLSELCAAPSPHRTDGKQVQQVEP